MKYKQIPRRQTPSGISFTNVVGDPPLTVREQLDVELLLETDEFENLPPMLTL